MKFYKIVKLLTDRKSIYIVSLYFDWQKKPENRIIVGKKNEK